MVAEGVFVMGSLGSYCTVEDVLGLLSGYDLTRLGTTEDVAERVRQLLGPTQAAIDAEAGRDFSFHSADERAVDGSGGDRLLLGAYGLWPVARVRWLRVDGVEIPATEYVVYGEEGMIRLKAAGRLGGVFARGVQNVQVSVDWGYPEPPQDIALAQAKLAAAQVLAEAAGSCGSAQSLRLGDYSVTYDAGGEHATTIERWVGEARRTAAARRGVAVAAV